MTDQVPAEMTAFLRNNAEGGVVVRNGTYSPAYLDSAWINGNDSLYHAKYMCDEARMRETELRAGHTCSLFLIAKATYHVQHWQYRRTAQGELQWNRIM